jgi:hypothetical protein
MSLMTEYQHGQFSWVDLMAHDMEAAREFYGELFGWTSTTMDTQGGPPYAQFELDGKSVAGIGQMPDAMKSQGVPPIWNSYINVDDAEAITKKAEELGAEITMPLMKVVEAGWLTYIQDPTGGNVGVWQKIQHFGAQLANDPGAFCWNELATKDVDKACAFYADLLGWEYEENPGSPTKYYIIKNQGRMNGGIMQMDEKWGDLPTNWGVYFSVEDVDTTAENATLLGGSVVAPPFDVPEVGRIGVVADAQGAVFSIIKLDAPPD